MSRAEEAARRAYPYDGGTKGLICENSIPIFVQGYEQAEKDLKLTWEDMKRIDELITELAFSEPNDTQEWYEELAHRFNEQRQK